MTRDDKEANRKMRRRKGKMAPNCRRKREKELAQMKKRVIIMSIENIEKDLKE